MNMFVLGHNIQQEITTINVFAHNFKRNTNIMDYKLKVIYSSTETFGMRLKSKLKSKIS